MSQWSVLPVELLEAIDELVILYADKVRLRSVSVPWHSPLSKMPHQKLHRSPCLLLPYDHENATSCSLFDPLDKKFYQLDKLPKPPQGGKLFKGSFHGWLVTAEDNSPSVGLINPLTGAQLKLPPRSSFPDVVKYRSNKPDHEYAIRAAYDKTEYYTLSSTHVRNFFTYKIVMLGSPNTSDDYLAVAIYGEFDRLAYCRKGYKKWVHLAGDRKPYVDVTFFRGQLYALACNAELLICEVGKCGAPTVTEIKNPACSPRSIGCKLYLVEHSCGLLMVERVLAPCRMGELSRTLGFVVRKFDDSYSSCVEVKDLGGDALFLGLNLSSYISPGDHFPECRRNCIYFTDDNMDFSYLDGVLEAGRGFDMGIYNLDDGEIERFPVPSYPCVGKHVFWPQPIWVVPKP